MNAPLTLADYFMATPSQAGRDVTYAADCTPEVRANAAHTLACVNAGLALFYADCPDAAQRRCNSGWRPPAINGAVPGAAAHSLHMTAEACDLSDTDRRLAHWSLGNQDRLRAVGVMAMERPESTPSWTHWQTRSPGSGVFAFWPSEAALAIWQRSGAPLMVG